MTLDEAIKHAEEVADRCEYEASRYDMTDAYESHMACEEGVCGEEHRQLAEWLKELKQFKAAGKDAKDEVIAEIDRQGEWLAEAGYNAYNVDIAFGSIIRALRKSVDTSPIK